jgi:hypothetical protein
MDGELFNFTFLDTTNNLSDDIFTLSLDEGGTYLWQHVGDGLGSSNWGSCRDRGQLGSYIIYTGHYDNLLMWYDTENSTTTRSVEITGLDDIEDLGMDRYGTVWASSYHRVFYPGLYRINPDTGEILAVFNEPEGLEIVDGIAIRSFGDHDVMYVTGKDAQFIWEYLVPAPATGGSLDGLAMPTVILLPNYPNPFNPRTTISFSTDQPRRVRLVVYDMAGRQIAELTDQLFQVGEHSFPWLGRDDAGRAVASGEYIFRIEFEGQVMTQKAMLMR